MKPNDPEYSWKMVMIIMLIIIGLLSIYVWVD